MTTTSASRTPKDSILKRFMQFLGLSRSPDTAEDIEQEIQDILEEGEEQGLITPVEGQMISSIFSFMDTLACEIMTPRTEMVCVADNASVAEVIKLIIDEGFTRIPVYAESLDHIIGIIHAKDLLRDCSSCVEPIDIKKIAMNASFVLENKKIVDLLRDFQAEKNHMVIITDEFGSVRGLVTLEDILEEIVGEISDEYDKISKNWRAIDEHTLLIDAKTDLSEVESFFNVTLPEGPYESVGGLIICQFGRVPEVSATTEINSLVFQVLSASKRRINSVKIIRSEHKGNLEKLPFYPNSPLQ